MINEMAGLIQLSNDFVVPEGLFLNIKYFATGDIPKKFFDYLKNGGAERLNYFSDYVTHLICGANAEENDVSDANDLYEIPAVSPDWVLMCIRLKRLISTKPYIYKIHKLFDHLIFCLSRPGPDREALWSIITYHGGRTQLNLNHKCTHLVTNDIHTEKYEKAQNFGGKIVIVTSDWILECVKSQSLVLSDIFHPRLIKLPKVIKHESTTAITGFEPERMEGLDKSADNTVADSTQALLDKLKQRMPWNQPQTSPQDIVPPNVVAPSFLSKSTVNVRFTQPQATQQQQQTFIQAQQNTITQVPRSTIHHTPQGQQLMPQQQSQQQPPPLQKQQLSSQMQQSGQLQQSALLQQAPQMQQPSQILQQSAQIQQQSLQLQTQPSQLQAQSTHLQQNQQLQQQQNVASSQQNTVTSQQLIPQQSQPSFNSPNQVPINRLIGQPQISRPVLQQLRGQLTPSQIHQQLIQHRLAAAQQQQPNLQRPLGLSQQQLLQQQLAQRQARQLIQNQQQLGSLNQQLLQQNQTQIGQPQVLQTQQTSQIGLPTLSQSQQLGSQHIAQQTSLGPLQQNILSQSQQFTNIVQSQHLMQQQQTQVSQQQQILQQNQTLSQQQQQQNQVLQQQSHVLQQQNQMLQQQNQVLQQQQNQVIQQQQQNQVLQQQQSQVMQQQQQNQVLQQQILQQQSPVSQQSNQNALQQPNKIFVPPLQPNQQLVQSQSNLGVQQQFVSQSQQFNQQQQQQQTSQNFVQNQSEQGLISQQVAQNSQFTQGLNQQILLNQQQNQFNQQQAQPNQQQQRPTLGQHLWQPQQQQTQQQQQPQSQMTVRHPLNIIQQGPRIQWSPNQQQPPNQLPQRQFIQLDAQTHNQLQKMNPEQQAIFVQRLQKQKQLLMQKQIQQRAGGGHILIRGSVPPGLSPQQQIQWLQRQAKQQGVVLPPNIQQQALATGQLTPSGAIAASGLQHTPGLSPIQQQAPPPQFNDQSQQQQQQQLQLRQYRFQQLQLQREQAQKNQLGTVQQQPQQGSLQPAVRPLGPTAVVPDSTTNPQEGSVSQQLVVNSKTKTALANMLSIRLQSGGAAVGQNSEAIPEPSAAGTLRLMTAQHNAALNPNNRSQDLIALQQRRTINGPNGEIIRPSIPPTLPATPQTDPPKIPFSPRAAVPLQHRPGPFYGHNPNLKLPPDLFLLGCVFTVVEIERYLDESIPGWQQKILKHGGELDKQYSPRITHVLCETQRHGVVMQALRDCKRCITIYWLSDVMKRKQVLPPWTALHLPTIYLDTTPVVKHLITLSGFEGCERNRVKRMINYTGAKFTSYFSKHNTLLIASKNEGVKFMHAKKWGIPVVNIQWLTDIMLGNFTAFHQMEHIMYQQFPTPPNFGFDPKLVPNLMMGWKMPINISQEIYERVKRSASPVVLQKKPKRLKIEQTDENDNVNDTDNPNSTHRILFSACVDLQNLQKIVRQLGGVLAKNHQDCTHLVMPSLARTNKLLFCICRDVHIMPEQWLRDSQAAHKFIDEVNYTLDTKDFNSEFKCDFAQTLSTRSRCRLFEGKFFWVTPSVFPSRRIIVELIQSCGGIVEKVRRTAAQIEATNINSPYSYIIIIHESDIHLVADLLRNKKDKIKIVCSPELIFSAILKQTFEVEPFSVKVL